MSSLSKLLNPNLRDFSSVPKRVFPIGFSKTSVYHLHSEYYPKKPTTPRFYIWISLTPKVWWQGFRGKPTAMISFENIHKDPVPMEEYRIQEEINKYRGFYE